MASTIARSELRTVTRSALLLRRLCQASLNGASIVSGGLCLAPVGCSSGTTAKSSNDSSEEELKEGSAPTRVFEDSGEKGGIGVSPDAPVSEIQCRAPRGACDEPIAHYAGSVVDGNTTGIIKGVGTQFLSIGIEQLPRDSFHSNVRPLALHLTSPPGDDYDLFVYDTVSCRKLASSSEEGAVDRLIVAPGEIDAGKVFFVVVEARFQSGDCNPAAPFELHYSSR